MKNSKILKSIIFSIVLIQFGLTGCLKDKSIELIPPTVSVCDSLNTDFTTVIQPMIVTNCSSMGCHNASMGAGGYTLETHSQISANPTIISNVINHKAGNSPMPSGAPKLADSLIQKFDCWVDKGMPQ